MTSRSAKKLPNEDVCETLCRAASRDTALEIASALAYLHNLNILHGDLSGGNILLTSSSKDSRKFTCKVCSWASSFQLFF
jgi:serine/threonine protein kinase